MQTDTTQPNITPKWDTEDRQHCRHIRTSGHRCGSPALRNERFCYYHHANRKPIPLQQIQKRKFIRGTFHMPAPEDRASIQHSLGSIIERLAANDIDPRRASLLLYALQIAGSNLPKEDPRKKPMPTVDQVVFDETFGVLAPLAPFNPDPRPMGSAEKMFLHMRSKYPELSRPQAAVYPSNLLTIATRAPDSPPNDPAQLQSAPDPASNHQQSTGQTQPPKQTSPLAPLQPHTQGRI